MKGLGMIAICPGDIHCILWTFHLFATHPSKNIKKHPHRTHTAILTPVVPDHQRNVSESLMNRMLAMGSKKTAKLTGTGTKARISRPTRK